ncbi:MAG: hypothetical protein WCG98_00365 [bacterium]
MPFTFALVIGHCEVILCVYANEKASVISIEYGESTTKQVQLFCRANPIEEISFSIFWSCTATSSALVQHKEFGCIEQSTEEQRDIHHPHPPPHQLLEGGTIGNGVTALQTRLQ